jgi:hypothetical protein
VEQTLVPCVLVSSTPRSCASGGELIQDVWDRWLAFDPVVNVHDRLDNLRQLSGILLDGGPNDDYNLHWGHRLLSHYLDEAGIAHEHRENPEITAAERTSATRSRWSGFHTFSSATKFVLTLEIGRRCEPVCVSVA